MRTMATPVYNTRSILKLLIGAIVACCCFVLASAQAQNDSRQATKKLPSALTTQMEKEVRAFFGTHKRSNECWYRSVPLYETVLQQMMLHDQPFAKYVGDGDILYSGGTPHDYDQSAALLYDSSGKIVAVGFSGCRWVWDKTIAHRTREMLVNLYVLDDGRKEDHLRELKNWRGYDYSPAVRQVVFVKLHDKK